MEQPLTEYDLAPREAAPVGVVVSNPAWRKYMRKEDVWEVDNQLEEYQVSAECIRPGDGSDCSVHGED